jgi:hypothetical protein
MLNRRAFVASAGLVLLAPLAAAADADGAEQAVAARSERLRLLMITPERSALEEIFAPDLSFGHSDGRVQTRAEYVDGLLTGKSVFKSIAISQQSIKVIGDVAIVRHRFDADAISNGNPSKPHIAAAGRS